MGSRRWQRRRDYLFKMSSLSQFASKAFQSALSTIGGEDLTLNGGEEISAALNEITDSQSYGDTGFTPISSFQAVASLATFQADYTSPIRSYIGATVEARSRKFRLTDITSGGSFVTFKLESISRS